MIQPERIQHLNRKNIDKGSYVLYWMQASQRVVCNHALEYAVREGNRLKQPVVVVFGITDRFPEANARHYAFMLEGLKEVQAALEKRGIRFILRHGSPEREAGDMGKEASVIITDVGYLGIQKAWRQALAKKASCAVIQVETDVVVPVAAAYEKEAYSAGILRPRIHGKWEKYLVQVKETPVRHDSLGMRFDSVSLADVPGLMASLRIDRTVLPAAGLQGGTSRAKTHLATFIQEKLKHYHTLRSDPGLDLGSNLSPYLHFGQISPLHIALTILQTPGKPKEAKDAYLEELIVRRELSMNFVHYNARYDSYQSLPSWALDTLQAHRKDKREYLYDRKQWEQAQTHDPYWNTAQKEMIVTGKMHNYMRMYWGKKILEWSETPEEAYATALYLNNKYELDGRDPNGFAGVAWCFGKHDRAWKERPVFGKVRYMNAAGLERKFDMNRYLKRWEFKN